MQTLQKKLGRAVQRLRKAKGFSQESFADHVGVHRTYMGAVERGEKNISLSSIEKIADALELRASELLSESEKER
jgi:transcriptional regulator with XRE-family HTH domain